MEVINRPHRGIIILAHTEIVVRRKDRAPQLEKIDVVIHGTAPHRIDDEESIRKPRMPPRSAINVDVQVPEA
jgi:hypothetical protein